MNKPPVRPSSASHASPPASRNLREAPEHREEKLPVVAEDGLIKILHGIIHFAVRVLAVMMVVLILWSVVDVGHVMYQRAAAQPFFLLSVADILAIFGAFLVVLIAIEIFINITLYIKHDVLPIKMVVATALMAMARKVIMLDIKDLEPLYIFAIAAVLVALGLTYSLISQRSSKPVQTEER